MGHILFAGFKSRWIIPLLWIKAIPAAICIMVFHIQDLENGRSMFLISSSRLWRPSSMSIKYHRQWLIESPQFQPPVSEAIMLMGGTFVRSFWIAVASFHMSLRATEGECNTFRANDCRINIDSQQRTHHVTSGRLNLERINPNKMSNLYLINPSKSAAAD